MDYDYTIASERAAYHRDATRKSREEWMQLGVKSVTNYVPEHLVNLVRGQTACATAVHMAQRVEEDSEVSLILGNRIPKYRIRHEDIDAIHGHNETVTKMCELMYELLRRARHHRMQTKDASMGPEVVTKSAACEYIIVNYLSGYYDIALHIVAGGDATLPLELDLNAMEDLPSVL